MKSIHCALAALVCVLAVLPVNAATITVKPTVDHPGARITIEGAGFQPGESIDVHWDDKPLFSVTADGNGNFAKQPTHVPKNAFPKTHMIQATGDNGGSAEEDF